MAIDMHCLRQAIYSGGSKDWREPFTVLRASEAISESDKILAAGYAGQVLVDGGDPEDYPEAVALLQEFLEHTYTHPTHPRELQIEYTAMLIHLFAKMAQRDQARTWFEALAPLERRGISHDEIRAVRQHERNLKSVFPWLESSH